MSINLIDCKNKLAGAEDSDAGSPGRQSKFWTQEHRDGLLRKSQEHRDGLHRKLTQEDHDGLPRKLAQEDRDGWRRTVAKFDTGSPGRQAKHWAHEHCDGFFGKLEGYRVNFKRERADLREGLPGKIEKVVTLNEKK